jgi:ATP-binding cassette subfamily F protein 3
MIFVQDLSLAFGGRQLFDRLTWTIRPKERVALVGPNGAGKSTLMKCLTGEQAYDGGQISFEAGASVGYLKQDIQEMDLERTPLEEAMTAFAHVERLEAEEVRLTEQMMAMLEDDVDTGGDDYMGLVDKLGHVQAKLAAHEQHLVKPRTEAVLAGLGFTTEEQNRPLSSFSGGWRMRVALAQLLLRRPDALLLDEPTNHLDIESIDWLEDYLKTYPGAVVLVSHDRYFLDRMTNRTAELAQGKVTEYAGNYAFYLEERTERRQLQQAAYDNQQRWIAETERFVARFRAKATKAKQAQSRLKQLEKLERIVPPEPEDGTIRFRFPEPRRSGRTVLEISKFSKAYPTDEGEHVVFQNAPPLELVREDKVALVGKNGAGKSTLARMLIGREPFEGSRELGFQVDLAYFAQHQAEEIELDQTVLEALREKAKGQPEPELRALLGAFLFKGDDVFKSVSVLSGGEKNRLALARTLLSPANLLVLDEPTNHLDMASKAVLAEALRQYTGTFILISHDRHFLDEVVNKVWYAEDRTVRAYAGTYSETHWQRTEGTAAKVGTHTNGSGDGAPEPAKLAQPQADDASSSRKTKADKRAEAEARRRLRQFTKGGSFDPKKLPADLIPAALEWAENTVAKHEEERAELEAALAAPDLYDDQDKFSKTMERFESAERKLARTMAHWEALAERAETA